MFFEYVFSVLTLSLFSRIRVLHAPLGKVISDSPFRVNVFGIAGAGLDLLTEPADVYVHGADISAVHSLVAPHIIKQRFPTVYLIGVHDQKL